MIDMQTQAPAPSDEERLRAAADHLGLNYDRATPDELEFLDVFAGGGLASLQPEADPENPLIPGEVPAPPAPAPALTPTDDVPPPPTGADDRVGPATTPGSGGEGGTDAPPAVTSSPTAPESLETPGRPAFQIPSPLLPAPAPVETPPAAAPELPPNTVQLPDGSIVTFETYQQIVAAQQAQQARQFGQAPAPAMPPNPWEQPPVPPVPNAWSPTPGEFVDERAAWEIAQLRQEQQQLAAQTAAALEVQRGIQQQGIDNAVEETVVGYAGARGLSYEQTNGLLDDAIRLGLVGVYAQHFPGDPRRAVAAAIENVYNNSPEMRELEIQRQVEARRTADLEVERKRALAGQTAPIPGSAPRVAQPARTRAEADAGIAAMIEADPAYQSNQAQRR